MVVLGNRGIGRRCIRTASSSPRERKFLIKALHALYSILLVVLASEAHQCRATTITLSPGANLQLAFENAQSGDVILLQAGTYTMLNGEPWFHIDTGITVQALGAVTLQPPAGAPFGLDVRATNTTVEGISIASADFGVVVRQNNGATPISNITIRGLTIQNAPAGHGILLQNVSDSVVEDCMIVSAYDNGIMLDVGSQRDYVVNNTIHNTIQQHGITVKDSNGNTVIGNTILGTGFHGILLIGASGNRVERNNISGERFDGITLDDDGSLRSTNNYIGQNTIGPNTQRTDGTGIWVIDHSDSNYIFGNIDNGAFEGAFSFFNTSNNYLQGNVGYGTGQAGVLIWREDALLPSPSHNVIHNNYLHDIVTNADALVRGAQYTEIGYNYFSNTFAGIQVASWTGVGGFSGPSTFTKAYGNKLANLSAGTYIGPDTTNMSVFGNRNLNTTEQFSLSPAQVSYDAGFFVGGNYWSNAPFVKPYTYFITDPATGANNGQYSDRYPFPNESMGNQYSVQALSPDAGSILAQGSQKTIAWMSQGCVNVDISYVPPAASPVPIVANYPDYGFYQWTVGAIPPANGYAVRIDCKRSDGTPTGVSATSGTFVIANSDLRLLTPGREVMADGGRTIRVSWKAAVYHPVDILIRSDPLAAWTVIAPSVTTDSINVLLPGWTSDRASIAIQATDSTTAADSVDERFSVRSSLGLFTSPANPVTFEIGQPVILNWVSPSGSASVDLSFWDSTSQVLLPIVSSLPDYGHYTWLVPDFWLTAGYLQAVFKSSNGSVVGTTNSLTMKLEYTTSAGSLVPWYRAYSPRTYEHLYTIDPNEYASLGAGGWSQEGIVGHIYNAPTIISGIDAVPFYRFFNATTLQHLWTADRNEYFTLNGASNWTAEGIAGYLFAQPVSGTIALYRLRGGPYHIWTSSLNEYQTLLTEGWISEGIAGYVFP